MINVPGGVICTQQPWIAKLINNKYHVSITDSIRKLFFWKNTKQVEVDKSIM